MWELQGDISDQIKIVGQVAEFTYRSDSLSKYIRQMWFQLKVLVLTLACELKNSSCFRQQSTINVNIFFFLNKCVLIMIAKDVV